jgi:arylsulfatase A
MRNPIEHQESGMSRLCRRTLVGGLAGLATAAVTSRGVGAAAGAPAASVQAAAEASRRSPNILLVLADDLGWGELGSYGQQLIRTPEADRLAADGLRFTQAYATPSCAPTRCSLLTGLHTGHATVKSNGDASGGLSSEDVTVGEVLQSVGYTTGVIGKWGLGPDNGDNPSHPNRQGFDHFFGYINQTHAHDYWPTYLWRNEQRVELPENDGADVAYASDLFTREALGFLDEHRDEPFFLYLGYTTPHAPNEIPSEAPYADMPWPEGERNHAAQVTRLDTDLGRILAKLDELGIADDTLVLFTSDNGPHNAGANYDHVGSALPHDPEFFDSNGQLRDIKFTVYEGGIRVPLIVRLPAALRERGLPAGSVVREPVAVWDLLPTLAELGDAEVPRPIDGLSLTPLFRGANLDDRDYLYWRGNNRAEAVRFGRWKGVRPRRDEPLELYDIHHDEREQRDLASTHAAILRQAERLISSAVA